MPSFFTAHRERIAWVVALATAVALAVSMTSQNAEAGSNGSPITTEVVYIATGVNFPDALVAGPVGGLGLGPVLLVQQDSIPAATLAELNRLHPPRVIIVGGTSVISDGVLAAIEGLSFSPDVQRIFGANRYETAAQLSAETFPTTGYYPRAAYGLSGDIPALAAGMNQTVLTVDITAPSDGILVINGGADTFRSTSDAVLQCWIERNNVIAVGSIRFVTLTTSVTSADCHTEVAIAVVAGVHTIELVTHQDSEVNGDDAALTVIWIPFGADGSVPAIP